MAKWTRRTSATVLVVMMMMAALGSAQQPPPQPQPAPADQQPDAKAKKNVLVVRGCVSGSMLTHVEPREYVSSVPSTLRTTGSRSVRGMLKELEGHQVELTGVLKGGATSQGTGALVKDTGKTKIYVGGTERRTAEDRLMQMPPLPTFDVQDVKDIAGTCGGA